MFLTRNRVGIKNNHFVPNINSKNYLLETLKSQSLSRYYHNSHCRNLLEENYLKCREAITDVTTSESQGHEHYKVRKPAGVTQGSDKFYAKILEEYRLRDINSD